MPGSVIIAQSLWSPDEMPRHHHKRFLVYYTPSSGFHGLDSFSIEVSYPNHAPEFDTWRDRCESRGASPTPTAKQACCRCLDERGRQLRRAPLLANFINSVSLRVQDTGHI
jgi:hypothetical protein